MKPFNLEEAKAGKPVVTRDGRLARIICFDAEGEFPIVFLVKTSEAELPIKASHIGRLCRDQDTSLDLFMKSEEKSMWVAVLRDRRGHEFMDYRNSKELLDEHLANVKLSFRFTVIKIEEIKYKV